jgi:hypothetical protein
MQVTTIASTGAVQQDIHKYEVAFRVLSLQERKRIIERDVEIEVAKAINEPY